jgi:small-conductance mechanosensitive channel/CRP-like cAMP-binding protein
MGPLSALHDFSRPFGRRAWALVVGAMVLLAAPGVAHAAEPGSQGAYRFAEYGTMGAVAAALVLLAFLVNRYAPKKRRHIRRSAILALLYLVACGVWIALTLLEQPGAAHTAREIGELLGVLTAVNLGALTLFDLALPAIKIEVATILSDIGVGVMYLVAGLATMKRAGVDFSSILATSALLTTITAFSLQSTLSNVVGGVALQFDESIKVGDWVQLENGRQGRVREIRWRYTVIETRDWDTLVVPNASLLSGTIIILGKRAGDPLQHRMTLYFNVDFRFSPTDVIRAVEDALQSAPIEGVAWEPKPHCLCLDLAKENRDSFAYYGVRYWLADLARDDPAASRVRERVYAALKRAGIPLALPGAQLWVEQEGTESRERKQKKEMDRRLAALASAEFLRPLRPDELQRIAEKLRYAPFAPGETMMQQGTVAHWFYLVVAGTAEVRVSVEGIEKPVAKIEAPNFFGEMGVMTGEPRAATVVALTDVECYRVGKEAFNDILRDRPEIAAEISSLLAQRRVELAAVREDLDVSAKQRRLDAERKRILGTVQSFFGLNDDERGRATWS